MPTQSVQPQARRAVAVGEEFPVGSLPDSTYRLVLNGLALTLDPGRVRRSPEGLIFGPKIWQKGLTLGSIKRGQDLRRSGFTAVLKWKF